MAIGEAVRYAQGEIERLTHSGLDSFAYREAAAARLRKVVAYDGLWWWTTDPSTAFFTSGVFDPCPDPEHDTEVCRSVHVNEFIEPDFNKFKVLARRSAHAGVLSRATDGEPERSARYREILSPMGFEHELRVALVDGDVCWGALTLMREPSGPDFTAVEARVIERLAATLAEGLRIGVVLGAVTTDSTADGPGLVVLDDDFRIVDSTPAAARWLAELDQGPWKGLPEAVMTVAECVRRMSSDRAQAATPRARVRGASGRWLVVHGSQLTAESRLGSTCVIIEEARPSEIAPIITSAYGLSEREADVTRLIFQGLSTREIAGELHLSAYTVQDYLKSVFEKVGVRSRRELVARIFEQYYWPRYEGGQKSPDADGTLAGLRHDRQRAATSAHA
jgi:DNA-binding CsgD family transcriptional regulator